MNKKPLFSIIIPVRHSTPHLRQTLKKLKDQSLKNFEVLVITDKISHTANPAVKRNLAAKKAKGKYLAFLDDDSYPAPDWLKNIKKTFVKNSHITAVCGPCLTPPEDNIYQQASGLVWASWLGSGGAGSYRNSIQSARFVDDYPTVNLIVKKTDFNKIGGFQTHHWPGEDTVLCLDLVKKLNKKILYHPSVIVYHHRRAVIFPHLKQMSRYAKMRGLFTKKYPATSARIGYIAPSLCLLYTLLLLPLKLSLFPFFLYALLLLISFFKFILDKNQIIPSLLAILTIPITHAYYGILFLYGLIIPQPQFTPRSINPETGHYHDD